jgi:hypothetical protein
VTSWETSERVLESGCLQERVCVGLVEQPYRLSQVGSASVLPDSLNSVLDTV